MAFAIEKLIAKLYFIFKGAVQRTSWVFNKRNS